MSTVAHGVPDPVEALPAKWLEDTKFWLSGDVTPSNKAFVLALRVCADELEVALAAPPREQPVREVGPDAAVTIVVPPSVAQLLLAAVLEQGDKVDVDVTDPASLRREADRIELEQAVKAAVSA